VGLSKELPHGGRTASFVLVLLLVATWALVVPTVAQAQIWVVTEADGTERFTTEPEPGARVFVRTRYTASRRVAPQVPFGDSIRDAAADNGIEPALVTAVIAAESNFDPGALSPKGAQGLMQLMPGTASDLGVRNVWDPDQNIRGGTAYLARLLGKYDNVTLALAAYNAGEGTVDRHGGVPPFEETQNYVARVLDYYRTYTQSND
jgi:soluble lytic murein transglycosylase-like protein